MASAQQAIIIGLGKTGLSFAQHLAKKNQPFSVMDSRQNPPCLSELQKNFPNTPLHLGAFNPELIPEASTLYMSPGVALTDPAIATVIRTKNVNLIGDIELFARTARAPIIAITGTNAKGTVVTLLAHMLRNAGHTLRVGGNIGQPALTLLNDSEPDFYLLEVSSFQLETTYSLRPLIASLLNISADHRDRHPTQEQYVTVKQRIYKNCHTAVWNRDDRATYPCYRTQQHLSFGIQNQKSDSCALTYIGDDLNLYCADQIVMPAASLALKGQHNWPNALAALTIGYRLQLPMDAMRAALQEFKGLPHRCQLIRKHAGIDWYNDSKATNVDATLAALRGLGQTKNIILIAGGLAKNADFTPLRDPIRQHVKQLILIGRDAPQLKRDLQDTTHIVEARDLAQALRYAQNSACPGDNVLLSPACASMDMFKNYEERGDLFIDLVRQLHD